MKDEKDIYIHSEICKNCMLRPIRTFTIKDIWDTFGENWDIATDLNLENLEKKAIIKAMRMCRMQKDAAKLLGISERRLSYRIKIYNLRGKFR